MRIKFLLTAACILNFLFLGCASTQKDKEAKKEIVATKIKHFDDLYASAANSTLRNGMTTAAAEETYGKPDDIYRSGSSNSQFEMWTYERVTMPGQEDWQPIRLYFNNGKLTSWKY